MAKLEILAGTTSKLLRVFIQNNSVTTGAGLTGLAFGTAGLTAYYIREGASSTTQITLATQTLGTWATGGFIVVDGTNMPGVYELSVPNAAIAAGAKSVLIYLQGATNMAPLLLEIELTAVDNQNANYGLTNLDAAISSRMATYTQPTGFLAATFPGTVASPTNITAGNITSVTNPVTIDGTSPLTEAYAAQGAALTVSKALYGITQQMGQMAIAGTTMTVKKRDGSTTAKTYTLDSATAPTTISETT